MSYNILHDIPGPCIEYCVRSIWHRISTLMSMVLCAFFTGTFPEKDHPPNKKFWTVPNTVKICQKIPIGPALWTVYASVRFEIKKRHLWANYEAISAPKNVHAYIHFVFQSLKIQLFLGIFLKYRRLTICWNIRIIKNVGRAGSHLRAGQVLFYIR